MKTGGEARPAGVTALSLFFCFGVAASFVAVVSLLFPGSFLEPMWRLKPRAREGFAVMGPWAILLMCVVCAGCASAAAGLWRGARWGYWLAVCLLVINLLGDVVNAAFGTEPGAILGVPVVLVILAYLTRGRARRFFERPADVGGGS